MILSGGGSLHQREQWPNPPADDTWKEHLLTQIISRQLFSSTPPSVKKLVILTCALIQVEGESLSTCYNVRKLGTVTRHRMRISSHWHWSHFGILFYFSRQAQQGGILSRNISSNSISLTAKCTKHFNEDIENLNFGINPNLYKFKSLIWSPIVKILPDLL